MPKIWVGVLVTVLYIGFIVYFRGSDAWCLLREGELDVLGAFLAGVFTPVILFWLIFGHFLQRDWQRKQINMEIKKRLRSQKKPIIPSDVLERLKRGSD